MIRVIPVSIAVALLAGSVIPPVAATDKQRPNVLFIVMHYLCLLVSGLIGNSRH